MRRLVNAPESNAGAEGEKCQWLVRKAPRRGMLRQIRYTIAYSSPCTAEEYIRTASIVLYVHQSKQQVEVNFVACSAVHLHDRTSVLPTAGLCFAQFKESSITHHRG